MSFLQFFTVDDEGEELPRITYHDDLVLKASKSRFFIQEIYFRYFTLGQPLFSQFQSFILNFSRIFGELSGKLTVATSSWLLWLKFQARTFFLSRIVFEMNSTFSILIRLKQVEQSKKITLILMKIFHVELLCHEIVVSRNIMIKYQRQLIR